MAYDQYRKIIHIDMDAFYASVEQRDFEAYRGKPIAVGGGERRGVTTTASYEARKYGVKSAMPGWKAKQLCPELIFVKPRFEVYRQVSKEIRAIFHRYTHLVEPLSLDEAYLDVSHIGDPYQSATQIALLIKDAINKELNLSASAGVSINKFLAKVASDMQKPNGLTVIKPHEVTNFLEALPIEKFFGVGKVTAQKMHKMHIFNGKDLKQLSKYQLAQTFGKSGLWYYDVVRGIDHRSVSPDHRRKSLAIERTLDEYMSSYDDAKAFIMTLIPKLFTSMEKYNFYGKTVTIKFKNKDFEIRTRSRSSVYPIQSESILETMIMDLLKENAEFCLDLRLIGISVSNPSDTENGQLLLPFV